MPSTSPKQARLMAAIAHGSIKPKKGQPSKAVAKEFNAADTGTGILNTPPRQKHKGALGDAMRKHHNKQRMESLRALKDK